jgi:hypothetical protein
MSAVGQENPAPIGIDDDVERLTEQITALKKLGENNSVDDGQIYDFSVRWGSALAGRLRRLVYYNASGLLNEADERRYQSLCDELRSVSALVERFGIARPRFSEAPSRPRFR